MTITIEFSLKEILDKLENKVDNLSENVNLRGDVKALQTEVSGLDQRIGNQECYHRCFSQCLLYQSPEAIFSPTKWVGAVGFRFPTGNCRLNLQTGNC